ncbi:hypothetical protein [Poseidonibacter lekithochrous]|uniref:hypothetical protein n=1 Tax=Poseidonibacter lekithochrous TaxID=1904463 RepID=UPI000D38AB6E|nr:hypothetical protein [Poseidonibacter lekithochrous]
MTKLNYSNYLKEKEFNFKEKYFELFEKKELLFIQLKKEYPYNLIFKQISFRELISEKKDFIETIEKRITVELKKSFYNEDRIKELFNYEGYNQNKKITPFITNNFNFTTCFFCNKDFITSFEKKEDSDKFVSTYQLDHFYDKGTYPYLALSFYNLIPSCSTCNSSKVKGTKNTYQNDARVGTFEHETCISPNSENFKFDEKVKFKLFLDKSCKNLHIKDKEDIDIELKEYYSNDYDKYIEVFKLNERYKAHKDIVYDMITKAELYPESRLKELQDLTGIPFQQIKKDIFKLIDENEDLSKKPFSKLIKDISEELGLCK